mgnify:CR=1 FL=1
MIPKPKRRIRPQSVRNSSMIQERSRKYFEESETQQFQQACNAEAKPGPPPSETVKTKAIKIVKSEAQSNRKMVPKIGKQQIKII